MEYYSTSTFHSLKAYKEIDIEKYLGYFDKFFVKRDGTTINKSGKEIVLSSFIATPLNIARDMINLIPEDVWGNKDIKVLDIHCKSGVFLYLMMEKLMSGLSQVIEDEQERLNHIINNCIYFSPSNRYVIDFITQFLGVSLNNMVEEKEYKEMEFNVVVGNPPYNNGADLDFINMGYDISTQYCCMITPAKWQTAEADQRIVSSMSYGEFRRKIVPHMSHVVFYPDCSDVFKIGQIDGIVYFLVDRKIVRDCHVKNVSRLQKYFNSVQERSILNGQSLLNTGNDLVEFLGGYKRYKIEKTDVKNRFQVWVNSQVCLGGATPWERTLLTVEGNLTMIGSIRIIDSSDTKDVDKIPGASNCIFSSDDRAECDSFVSWINTRFTRFFVAINISKLTGILTDHCFRFVPAPAVLDEYGNRVPGKFDHIYTDEELYKTFNLPQKYIDVIESVIKERK